jgi:hypothetical protein
VASQSNDNLTSRLLKCDGICLDQRDARFIAHYASKGMA